MNQTHIYTLDQHKRFLHSPLPVKQIGWMPHHIYFHRNNLIRDLFVCISSNLETQSESLINGVLRHSSPNPLPHFGLVLPGTLINTIHASYHDELFFAYSPEHVPFFANIFGKELLENKGFYFTGVPDTLIAELKHELAHFDEPGVPDLLDQLAIQLFTRIIIQHKQEQQGVNSLRLKLHSIASELDQGRKLCHVLKQYSLSERTFYREWKKIFACSPKEYLMKYRLEHACTLLMETDLPLNVIYEKCGFASDVYFHQFFQKKTGMSPGKFRRKKANLFPAG